MGKSQDIIKVVKLLEEEYPDARIELDYHTPFQLLVATILAAQSTDVQVNKVTKELFKLYPEPKDYAGLELEHLQERIKSIGLFRNKSKNIIKSSKIIIDEYGGDVPQTLEGLLRLPGVGRKTANVVLSNAFGVPAIAVDTHVFRVANRLGLGRGKNPLEVEMALQKNLPKNLWLDTHNLLIFHGRRRCHARKPDCDSCVVLRFCHHNP